MTSIKIRRLFNILLAVLLICGSTVNLALAEDAPTGGASDEKKIVQSDDTTDISAKAVKEDSIDLADDSKDASGKSSDEETNSGGAYEEPGIGDDNDNEGNDSEITEESSGKSDDDLNNDGDESDVIEDPIDDGDDSEPTGGDGVSNNADGDDPAGDDINQDEPNSGTFEPGEESVTIKTVRIVGNDIDKDWIIEQKDAQYVHMFIDRFFLGLLTGGYGDDTVIMIVNGEEYAFKLYSDGNYEGSLPIGFSATEGGSLDIDLAYYDYLDIEIISKTSASSMYEEPEVEGVCSIPDDSVFEDPDNKTPESNKNDSSGNRRNRVSTYDGYQPYTADYIVAEEEEISEKPDKKAPPTTKVDFEALKAEVIGNTSAVFNAFDGETPLNVPLASGLVAFVGAVLGFGAWEITRKR